MTDVKLKEKFIELRAGGVSFDNIANKLKKSKTTLIKWQSELDKEINNLKYSEIQNLIEKYKITKQRKIEFYSKQLEKVYEALEKKDYESISVKELNDLREKIENRLSDEKEKIKYFTGETITTNQFDLSSLVSTEDVTVPL
jgi:transposase